MEIMFSNLHDVGRRPAGQLPADFGTGAHHPRPVYYIIPKSAETPRSIANQQQLASTVAAAIKPQLLPKKSSGKKQPKLAPAPTAGGSGNRTSKQQATSSKMPQSLLKKKEAKVKPMVKVKPFNEEDVEVDIENLDPEVDPTTPSGNSSRHIGNTSQKQNKGSNALREYRKTMPASKDERLGDYQEDGSMQPPPPKAAKKAGCRGRVRPARPRSLFEVANKIKDLDDYDTRVKKYLKDVQPLDPADIIEDKSDKEDEEGDDGKEEGGINRGVEEEGEASNPYLPQDGSSDASTYRGQCARRLPLKLILKSGRLRCSIENWEDFELALLKKDSLAGILAKIHKYHYLIGAGSKRINRKAKAEQKMLAETLENTDPTTTTTVSVVSPQVEPSYTELLEQLEVELAEAEKIFNSKPDDWLPQPWMAEALAGEPFSEEAKVNEDVGSRLGNVLTPPVDFPTPDFRSIQPAEQMVTQPANGSRLENVLTPPVDFSSTDFRPIQPAEQTAFQPSPSTVQSPPGNRLGNVLTPPVDFPTTDFQPIQPAEQHTAAKPTNNTEKPKSMTGSDGTGDKMYPTVIGTSTVTSGAYNKVLGPVMSCSDTNPRAYVGQTGTSNQTFAGNQYLSQNWYHGQQQQSQGFIGGQNLPETIYRQGNQSGQFQQQTIVTGQQQHQSQPHTQQQFQVQGQHYQILIHRGQVQQNHGPRYQHQQQLPPKSSSYQVTLAPRDFHAANTPRYTLANQCAPATRPQMTMATQVGQAPNQIQHQSQGVVAGNPRCVPQMVGLNMNQIKRPQCNPQHNAMTSGPNLDQQQNTNHGASLLQHHQSTSNHQWTPQQQIQSPSSVIPQGVSDQGDKIGVPKLTIQDLSPPREDYNQTMINHAMRVHEYRERHLANRFMESQNPWMGVQASAIKQKYQRMALNPTAYHQPVANSVNVGLQQTPSFANQENLAPNNQDQMYHPQQQQQQWFQPNTLQQRTIAAMNPGTLKFTSDQFCDFMNQI